MARFIKLTGFGGAELMVNADHIVTLQAANNGATFVALTNLSPLYVVESIHLIADMGGSSNDA